MNTEIAKISKTGIKNMEVFGEMMNDAANKTVEACKFYVAEITREPELIIEYRKKYPNISSSMWARLESVGRGTLIEGMLFKSSAGCNRLSKLSVSQQKYFLKNPVQILASDGTMINVKVDYLTREQVKQAFDGNHVRGEEAQKSYLECLKNIKPKKKMPSYRIENGKFIHKGVEFSKDMVLDILREL